MKTSDLPNFILLMLFVGMLIGVGIITILAVGDAARQTVTVTNENHTFSTDAGVALTNTQVRDFTSLTNHSTTLTLNTDYNVSIGDSTTTVLVDASYNNSQLNASYRYYTDTTATTAMDNVNTAVSTIPSTWIALIVTIFVLSIILGLVLTSFNQR